MDRPDNTVRNRSEAMRDAQREAIDKELRRRRWRSLQSAAQPHERSLDQVPAWVKTPEQFVGWLATRLTPADLRTYFRDLEVHAKRGCDLEMLRFARKYQKYD